MRRRDLNDLRNDISAIDLDGRADFSLVHCEHLPIQLGRVPKLWNGLSGLDERSFFDLRVVFLCDSIEVFVAHEVNGGLLRQIARPLFGLSSFNYGADCLFQLVETALAPFLLTIHFDDVNSKLCLHEITDGAYTQAECYALEVGDHLAASEIAEISAVCVGRGFGVLLRQAAEIFALLCPLQDATSFLFDLFDLFRSLALGLEQNVLRFHAFRKRVLVFVLLVVLAQFVITDFDFGAQFERFEKYVLRFPLLGNGVLRFVLLVVITLVLFGNRDFVLEFGGVYNEVVEFGLLIATLVFLFRVFVVDAYTGGYKAPQLLLEDFIRDTRFKVFDRELVLRQDGLITGGSDEGAVFAEDWVFEDLLFNFGRCSIQPKPLRFFGDDVLDHESVHNLPLEMERTQHFRVELSSHPLHVVAVGRLEFASADAIAADRSDVAADGDIGKVAGWDIERHQRDAKYKDEDHPNPLQGGALTPHEIQHRWSPRIIRGQAPPGNFRMGEKLKPKFFLRPEIPPFLSYDPELS